MELTPWPEDLPKELCDAGDESIEKWLPDLPAGCIEDADGGETDDAPPEADPDKSLEIALREVMEPEDFEDE